MLSLLLFLFVTAPCIAEAKRLPPKVIYHFGHKPHMLENAKLDTIREDVWKNSIMGGEGRYSLRPFRRGLYGAERIEAAEVYGGIYVGVKDKTPWVMAVHIKDGCRQPEKVANFFASNEPEFAEWIIGNFTELFAQSVECLSNAPTSCEDIFSFHNVDLISSSKRPESRCEQLLQKYLADGNYKIVDDSSHGDSWYIRDRDCIEKIDGSPEEVLEMFAQAEWSQAALNTGIMPGGAQGSGLYVTLFSALGDMEKLSPELAEKLRAKALGSDLEVYDYWWKDITIKRGSQQWMAENVPILLDAFARCEAKGGLESFREVAKKFDLRMKHEDSARFREFPEAIWDTAEHLRSLCR